MKEYGKIQTVFLRDPANNMKTLLDGKFSLPEFEYLKDTQWVFTEKVHGENSRVIINVVKKHIYVSFKGKKESTSIRPHLLEKINKMFLNGLMFVKIRETFLGNDKENMSICLYGEGYGAQIQNSGELYRNDQSFVLFDVNVDGLWLERKNVEDIAKKLDLEIVPIIGEGTLSDMVKIVSKGFYSYWGNFMAEGIVARPKIEMLTRRGERIITKLKYKDFHRE